MWHIRNDTKVMSCSTARKGAILTLKAVETQGNGNVLLAVKTVEPQGKGALLLAVDARARSLGRPFLVRRTVGAAVPCSQQ